MMINLLANNGYIVLNKILMKKVGLYEAILIGELSSEQIYWEKRNELVDGYFYSTRENIEEQTMLSAHQQRIAIENLKKMGILEVKLFGMPQKAWYKIIEDGLVHTLNGEGNFINILANSNYIVVNKNIMKTLGLNEAVLIGELSAEYLYWQKNGELKENYFYSTRENIEEQTMLSAYQQRITIGNLIDNGIINTRQKGMPLRTWYTINEDAIYKLVSENLEKSSSKKIEHQVVKKFNNKSSNSLTPCCEKIEHHVVKNFNINNNKNNNNNNKIDRLFNYIINKEQKIPEEFSEINFDDVYSMLYYYDMLYTEDIIESMQSEENKKRIKQITYTVALLVKDNWQGYCNNITREDLINIYNECKNRENEYKGTANEIEDFTRYYYRSVVNELKRGNTSSFFVLKNQQTEEDEEER